MLPLQVLEHPINFWARIQVTWSGLLSRSVGSGCEGYDLVLPEDARGLFSV